MRFATRTRTMVTMGGQLALFALVVLAGCARDTSTLTPAWQQRFETEGIVRRADNVIVRHTREAGRWDNSYKDRLASLLVTHGTILIHQGERVLLEVTPRTRRDISITRRGGRVRIRAVGQRVTEIFSFEPKEDAAGWAEDLREVASPAGRTP
ncbi:MAG TPA: hypothetical protein VFS09_12535 [Candidatus Eisenbacteria bacterium]|nr:hypothetical protein [Candidatus Eisenbacteria bacterium]